MQQIAEQQNENIELRKEMLSGLPDISRVKKPERPTLGLVNISKINCVNVLSLFIRAGIYNL